MPRLARVLAILCLLHPLHPLRALADPVVVAVAGGGPAGWDAGTNAGDGTGALSAGLNGPTAVAAAPDGRIFIADYFNDRIRAVDTLGGISTLAGDGWPGYHNDGTALSSSLWGPWGVAPLSGGAVLTDTFNSVVRKVSSGGTLSDYAGTLGASGFAGDGGLGNTARLNWPLGVTTDAYGVTYVADSFNNRVRTIVASTRIATIAGDGWTDAWGRGRFAGDNGPAISASLNWPSAVAVDSALNVYIADTYNQRIRRVDKATGIITTVAGNGEVGGDGDGGPATEARLNYPQGVAVATDGTLYIADSMNHRIRAVSGGMIRTVAGDGVRGLSGDNGPAAAARFNEPRGLALNSRGDLLVADSGNNRVRLVMFGAFGILAGTVRDANTDALLPGATVGWNGLVATSGADGTYSIPVGAGVQAGTAGMPAFGTVTDAVTVTEGATTSHDFRLPSGWISGRVVDDAGHAVSGALVTGTGDGEMSAADGSFVVRAAPGVATIRATRSGYGASLQKSASVQAGATAAGVLLTVYRFHSVPLALSPNADWISPHENAGDYTTPSSDYAFPAEQLPASGSTFSLAVDTGSVDFTFPNKADGAMNAMRVSGQTLSVPSGQYGAVHFLEASQFGAFTGTITLSYADGATTSTAVRFSDWAWSAIGQTLGSFESVAIPCDHRHKAGEPQAGPPVDILHMAIPADTSRRLVSIRLPAVTGSPQPYLFAAALDLVGGPLYGDLNGDGLVTLADASAALSSAAGLSPAPSAAALGDIAPSYPDGTFGDGRLGLDDAVAILRRASGM